jgi:hypothetical protein
VFKVGLGYNSFVAAKIIGRPAPNLSPSEKPVMLTAQEYEQLKKQLEDDRKRAEEEYKKDLEALDRVYRIKNRIASTEQDSPHPDNNGAHADDDDSKTTIARGDLSKAVKAAVKAMPSDFTILTIESALLEQGVQAKKTSIRPVLARLEEDKEIEVVTQGIGRRATVYRRKKV